MVLLVAKLAEVFEILAFGFEVCAIRGDGRPVLTVFFPRTVGHLGIFDEAPVTLLAGLQVEVISDGWRNIDGGTFVRTVLRAAVSEDIVVVIGHPWAAIFPLGVAASATVINLNPSPFEHGFTRFGVHAAEPGDDARGFRFVAAPSGDVVVGQGDVKRIEPRSEFFRSEFSAAMIGDASRWIRIVVAAVVFAPLLIPRRLVIGGRVVLRWLFTDPEDGGGDVLPPWVKLRRLRLDRAHGLDLLAAGRDDDAWQIRCAGNGLGMQAGYRSEKEGHTEGMKWVTHEGDWREKATSRSFWQSKM